MENDIKQEDVERLAHEWKETMSTSIDSGIQTFEIISDEIKSRMNKEHEDWTEREKDLVKNELGLLFYFVEETKRRLQIMLDFSKLEKSALKSDGYILRELTEHIEGQRQQVDNMVSFVSIKPNGNIDVADENGKHYFNTQEEYDAYKYEIAKNLPIPCDNCFYHCQDKPKCPLGEHEGEVVSCTHFYPNPKNSKDWIRRYWFLIRQWYYWWMMHLMSKYEFGIYKTNRKRFVYWPSLKYPFFVFVKRIRNEYYDECRACKIGFVSKENSHWKKPCLYEKYNVRYMQKHINYEYADCIKDCYVDTINNIKTIDSYFKCTAGTTYRVRHVKKYKYYDIVFTVENGNDEIIHLLGQISESEFNEHFDYKPIFNTEK